MEMMMAWMMAMTVSLLMDLKSRQVSSNIEQRHHNLNEDSEDELLSFGYFCCSIFLLYSLEVKFVELHWRISLHEFVSNSDVKSCQFVAI